LVKQVTDGFRLTADEAAEVAWGVIMLVDGTLWPSWSWDGEDELWSGKYKATGHGSLIITNLQGRITFVSEACHRQRHDMANCRDQMLRES
jgi:hypothetical protein